MLHVAGGREQVSTTSGASRAELTVVREQSAGTVVGEWLDHCAKRPPERVIGQMSREIKKLLNEGIDPDHVRRGIAEWMQRDVHPSVLPSLVNSVMNRAPTQGRGTTKAAGWLSLGDPEGA